MTPGGGLGFRPHIDWSICQVTPRALAQKECPPGAAECNLRTPIKASPEDWFMPGDNRGESDDSRFGTRSSILDHRHRAMVLARRGPVQGDGFGFEIEPRPSA